MFPIHGLAAREVRQVRALAVAGPKRSALLPDVPTLKEAGVDGVRAAAALLAPAKTPKAIVDQLNKALNQVLADKEIVKRMEEHAAPTSRRAPRKLGALVKSELAKWKGVVQRAKRTAQVSTKRGFEHGHFTSELQVWTGCSETWRDQVGATPVKALNAMLHYSC